MISINRHKILHLCTLIVSAEEFIDQNCSQHLSVEQYVDSVTVLCPAIKLFLCVLAIILTLTRETGQVHKRSAGSTALTWSKSEMQKRVKFFKALDGLVCTERMHQVHGNGPEEVK